MQLSLSGPGTVREATLAARDFAARSGLDTAGAARLAIVVEELVANLYDHGGLGDDDEVGIDLSARADSVRFVLTAPGAPFHPGQPLAETEIPERGGGAGLKFVQAWSLSIEHELRDCRNRWAVVLPLGPKS
jgi:serine/threonine-protein kinase RsbW